ncbi:hypothetical protein MBOL_39790 [Mycobacteroides abscessus subsp. bolletii BD]|nr:hypothetical protein MBOL_39790 [Mycobacteroides abscessus subsp. bolletii BD]
MHEQLTDPHPADTTTVLLFIRNCTSISPVAQGLFAHYGKRHAAGLRQRPPEP